jgi:hypothetical protein
MHARVLDGEYVQITFCDTGIVCLQTAHLILEWMGYN